MAFLRWPLVGWSQLRSYLQSIAIDRNFSLLQTNPWENMVEENFAPIELLEQLQNVALHFSCTFPAMGPFLSKKKRVKESNLGRFRGQKILEYNLRPRHSMEPNFAFLSRSLDSNNFLSWDAKLQPSRTRFDSLGYLRVSVTNSSTLLGCNCNTSGVPRILFTQLPTID